MKLLIAAAVLLALIAVAAAFVLLKAHRHEANAVRTHPPEGQIIVIGPIQVHAVVMGSGPDLVLLHGSSGNTRDFTHSLAGKLAERYRVIVMDRPGHGYTDRMNFTGATITEQAELLSAAAARLGAERPIVLGHSYGGAVALAWAVHRPDNISGLVLLASPSQPWTTPLDRFYRVTSHPVLGRLMVPLITAFTDDARVSQRLDEIFAPQAPPDGYHAHVGAGLTLRRSSLRANALQRANLLREIIALHPLYPSISVPTEIVHGTTDTTVGLKIHAEPLARQIPGARLTVLEGIGHMPQHAAQDQVVDAVRRVARN